MGFEKPQQTPENIIEANLQRHSEKLFDQMESVELSYAENKFENQDAAGEKSFSKILEEETPIIESLVNKYNQQHNRQKDESKQAEFKKALAKKIDKAFEVDDRRLENVKNILDQVNVEIGEVKWRESKREKAGQLDFVAIDKNNRHTSLEYLKERGFSKDDDLIEIHFPEVYKNEQAGLALGEIKKSLSKLAVAIVKDYPATRGVVGTSWLMDHPIIQKLGFQVAKDLKMPQNNDSTWLQLVDKDGQINKTRLKQLRETGELPYQSRFGYITVEDFLKKYLPQELRGEVNLKQTDPEWVERNQRREKAVKDFKAGWDDFLEKEQSVTEYISQFPEFAEILDKVGVKNDFILLMSEYKEKQLKYSDIAELSPSQLKQNIDERFKEYEQTHRYKNLRVLI